MRKQISLLLVLVLLFSLAACNTQKPVETQAPTQAPTNAPETKPAETTEATLPPKDVAILFTNDVHTYIDKPLSYDVLSGLKNELYSLYDYVLTVDAGDAIQGTAYGSMDKGATIVELMNQVGYDVATLGNHEFDYGMDGCMNVIAQAAYPYVSCNFRHEKDGVAGDTVLDPYALFVQGNEVIAFIGITTPESFTKSTPAYFQDDNGTYIYGISGGEDGSALYDDVQAAIDLAKKDGATKIIALGHLGVDLSSSPWTSKEVIANVSGLDAFIDGHSHTVMEGELVTDKDGNQVLLAQTGQYFDSIGMMVIDGETGAITTDLIGCAEILADKVGEDGKPVKDENGNTVQEVVGYEYVSDLFSGLEWMPELGATEIKDNWIAEIDNKLGTVVGTVNVALGNYDADGKRLVRSQETVTGDFCADALYWLFDSMGLDVDVAVMNGGGVRNKTDITGDFSYKTAKEIHTFGNVACLQTVTGQQLLDALEWGARTTGTGEECGGFLQVSGITYQIDTEWPASLQADDKGVWVGGPIGGYRVHDVMVYNKETGAYEALDLNAKYNLAGYNYTLRDLGDGFNMFSGAVNVLDYVMEDYMVLASYVEAFPDGVVDAANSPLLAKYPGMLLDYSQLQGSGRITFAPTE